MKLHQLFTIVGISLLLICISCAEDRSVFGDDFGTPKMTDENTIQFTVEVVSNSRLLDLSAGGGRMVIDWGDGRLQKIEDPEQTVISYKYGNCRNYRVKIWAEELDYCVIGTELLNVSDLHLGSLPRMKNLYINSFKSTAELDLNASCPNLEDIGISNMPDLERIDIDQCDRLRTIQISSNPKLTLLEMGSKPYLEKLYCLNNNLSSLKLKGMPNLKEVDCSYNRNLSTLDFDNNMGISALLINNCNFNKIDFLDKLPSIMDFGCSYNKLTELHMPGTFSIAYLRCNNNQLTRLSIEDTWILNQLDCHANCLEADALNDLFESLEPVRQVDYMRYILSIYDNPGEKNCRKEIPIGKGWKLDDNRWN